MKKGCKAVHLSKEPERLPVSEDVDTRGISSNIEDTNNTLTSSYELCHRSSLPGWVSSPWAGGATSSWIRHTSTELSMPRTLNEGSKGFRANLKPENRSFKNSLPHRKKVPSGA